MKYDILVTTSVDTLVQFESDEKYTKDQIREIIDKIMERSDNDIREKLKADVYWSVASGRDISYMIDDEIQ